MAHPVLGLALFHRAPARPLRVAVEVGEVVAGEGGLLQGASEGSLIVDMSTSSPVLARELARTPASGGSGCSTPRSAGAT